MRTRSRRKGRPDGRGGTFLSGWVSMFTTPRDARPTVFIRRNCFFNGGGGVFQGSGGGGILLGGAGGIHWSDDGSGGRRVISIGGISIRQSFRIGRVTGYNH